jgi:hypothetical protein
MQPHSLYGPSYIGADRNIKRKIGRHDIAEVLPEGSKMKSRKALCGRGRSSVLMVIVAIFGWPLIEASANIQPYGTYD